MDGALPGTPAGLITCQPEAELQPASCRMLIEYAWLY